MLKMKTKTNQEESYEAERRRHERTARSAASSTASEDSSASSASNEPMLSSSGRRRRFSFVPAAGRQRLKLSPPTPRRLIRMIAERRQDSRSAGAAPTTTAAPPQLDTPDWSPAADRLQQMSRPTDNHNQLAAMASSRPESPLPPPPARPPPLPLPLPQAGPTQVTTPTSADGDASRKTARKRRLIRSPHLSFNHRSFLLSTLGSSSGSSSAAAAAGPPTTRAPSQGSQPNKQQHRTDLELNKLISILNELSSERNSRAAESNNPVPIGRDDCQQQDAIWELISTEQTYINRLRLIVGLFLGTLASLQTRHGLLLEVDRQRLCSNVDQILAANQQLYETHLRPILESRLVVDITSSNDQRQQQHSLHGDLVHLQEAFANVCQLFEPYYRYCLEQVQCINYIRQLKELNEGFKVYLAWCESQRECDRLRLSDLLAHPMQRLTRYPLLLKSVAKQIQSAGHECQPVADQLEALGAAEAIGQTIGLVDKFVLTVDLELKRKNDFDQLVEVANRLLVRAVETTAGWDQQLQQQQQGGWTSQGQTIQSILGAYNGQFDLMRPLFDCHHGCARQLIFDSSAAASARGDLAPSQWTSSNGKTSGNHPLVSQIKFRDSLCPSGKPVDVIILIFTDQLFVCRQQLATTNCGPHGDGGGGGGGQSQLFRSTVHLNSSSSSSLAPQPQPQPQPQPAAGQSPNGGLNGRLTGSSQSFGGPCRRPTTTTPTNTTTTTTSHQGNPVRARAASHSYVGPLLATSPDFLRQASELNLIALQDQDRSDSSTSATNDTTTRRVNSENENNKQVASPTRVLGPNHGDSNNNNKLTSIGPNLNEASRWTSVGQLHHEAAPKNHHQQQQQVNDSSASALISSMTNSPWRFSLTSDQLDNQNYPGTSCGAKQQRQQHLRPIRGPYPIERLVMHELDGGLGVLFCQLNDSSTIASSFVLQFPKRQATISGAPPSSASASRGAGLTLATSAATSVLSATHSSSTPTAASAAKAATPEATDTAPTTCAIGHQRTGTWATTTAAGRNCKQAASLSLEYPRRAHQQQQHRATAARLFGGRKAHSQRVKSNESMGSLGEAPMDSGRSVDDARASRLQSVKSCSDIGGAAMSPPDHRSIGGGGGQLVSAASQLIGLVKQAQARYRMAAQWHGVALVTFGELHFTPRSSMVRSPASLVADHSCLDANSRHLDESRYLKYCGEQHQMFMLSHGQHELLARNNFHYKLAKDFAGRIVASIEAEPIGGPCPTLDSTTVDSGHDGAPVGFNLTGQQRPQAADHLLTVPLELTTTSGGGGGPASIGNQVRAKPVGRQLSRSSCEQSVSYKSSLSSQHNLSAGSSWADFGCDRDRDHDQVAASAYKCNVGDGRGRRPLYFSRSTRATCCGGSRGQLEDPSNIDNNNNNKLLSAEPHRRYTSNAPLRRQQVIHTSSDQSSLLPREGQQQQQRALDGWRSKFSLSTKGSPHHPPDQAAYGANWPEYGHHSLPNSSKSNSLDFWQRLSHDIPAPDYSQQQDEEAEEEEVNEHHSATGSQITRVNEPQHPMMSCLMAAPGAQAAPDQQQREPRTSSFELGNLRTDSHGRRPYLYQQFLAYGGHRSASAEVRSPVYVTLTSPRDDDNDDDGVDIGDNIAEELSAPQDHKGSISGEHNVADDDRLDPTATCYHTEILTNSLQATSSSRDSDLPQTIFRQRKPVTCSSNSGSSRVLAHRVGQVGDRIQGMARALSSWINNLNRRDSF